MLKFPDFIFRNWNLLSVWKRRNENNFFQLFKPVSFENVQDFEIFSAQAELLEGRVPLAETVKVLGSVEPLFPCRNAGQAVLGESCFAEITVLALTTREFSQNSCVSQQSYFGINLYCVPSLIFGVELTLQ